MESCISPPRTPSEYEQKQALNIAENQRKLQELILPLSLNTDDISTVEEKSKYGHGYWLSTEDLSFIICCFVSVKSSDKRYHVALAYDDFIKILIRDWSKDTPLQGRIINTDRASSAGRHWIVASWVCNNKLLTVNLWDPYPNTLLSAKCKNDINKKLMTHANKNKEQTLKPVALIGTGLQQVNDGFGCGYISAWLLLMFVPYFKQGGSVEDWSETHNFDPPPETWFKLIYKLLAVRDIQPINHSALNLNLKELWQSSLDSGAFKYAQMLKQIKKYTAELKVIVVVVVNERAEQQRALKYSKEDSIQLRPKIYRQ